MDSLSFLGTGPGDIDAGRFQSSILLKSGDAHILLDAGEPCAQRLIESGRRLEDLEAILLTHCHADHVGGLPLLIQGAWLAGRSRPLPIYLPAHLVAPLRAWLDAILLSPDKVKFEVSLLPWREGELHDLGPVQVRPYPTSHIAPMEGQARSFLLDIQGDDKRIVYSGDIGSMADLKPVLGESLNVLICELAHVGPEDLVASLQDVQIDMLCLTHLSRQLSGERGAVKITVEERLPHVSFVYLPMDGETIDL